MTSRRPTLILFAIVTVLALWAEVHLALTRPFAGRLGDQEPEAHIMVSELAMEQTSWRVHHFLPIFTLGAQYNKGIDDHPGAESADKLGNYYYVSTPPLAFDLPYLFAKLTGGAPTMFRLRAYNLFLQYTSAAALAWLVFLCGKHSGKDRNLSFLAALTAALIYITAPECLHSHTIALWAQQVICLLLVLQIIVFLFRPSWWLLGLMAFVGCLSDWTPYVANFGMAAIALYSFAKTRDRRNLKIALALVAGVALAGLVMVLWFHTEYSVASYLADLKGRHAARSEGGFALDRFFLPRYLDSFGFFTVIGLAAVVLRPWKGSLAVGREDQPILPGAKPFWIAIGVFAIALLENEIMKVHALKYSYDRLKGVELLAIVVAWAAMRSMRSAQVLFASSVAVGLVSVGLFYIAYETPRGYSYVPRAQQQAIGEIVLRTAENSPAFVNFDTRGSEVYYAQRNLVEFDGEASDNTLLDLAKTWCQQHHDASGMVYELVGGYYTAGPTAYPRTLRILRVYADQHPVLVGEVKLNETQADYHPLFDGYSRHLMPVFKK